MDAAETRTVCQLSEGCRHSLGHPMSRGANPAFVRRPGKPMRLSLKEHASELEALLDQLDIERAVLVGRTGSTS
jgi:hypothetical protein